MPKWHPCPKPTHEPVGSMDIYACLGACSQTRLRNDIHPHSHNTHEVIGVGVWVSLMRMIDVMLQSCSNANIIQHCKARLNVANHKCAVVSWIIMLGDVVLDVVTTNMSYKN